MKLIDLNPRWFTGKEQASDPERHGLGVGFDCPRCRASRIMVPFTEPLDGAPQIPYFAGRGWARTRSRRSP